MEPLIRFKLIPSDYKTDMLVINTIGAYLFTIFLFIPKAPAVGIEPTLSFIRPLVNSQVQLPLCHTGALDTTFTSWQSYKDSNLGLLINSQLCTPATT